MAQLQADMMSVPMEEGLQTAWQELKHYRLIDCLGTRGSKFPPCAPPLIKRLIRGGVTRLSNTVAANKK